MEGIGHFRILNKALKLLWCTPMQIIELPALAWSTLTNTIQRAQFSPHHNLPSAHPHLLLFFSTILTKDENLYKIHVFPFPVPFPQLWQKGGHRFYSQATSAHFLKRVALQLFTVVEWQHFSYITPGHRPANEVDWTTRAFRGDKFLP